MAFTQWDTTFSATPDDGDNPGLGDDAIRDLKEGVETIQNREHRFLNTPSDEYTRQGIHRPGSAVPFISDSEPTVRVDGSAFEEDYDEGRIWIDTSDGNPKLKYISEIDSGTPTWTPVSTESIGKVQAFVIAPDTDERWIACDGRAINKTETAEDGTDGGYSALVTALETEISGDTSHPLYNATTDAVYIPDLRGMFLRGTDNFNTTLGKKEEESEDRREDSIGSDGAGTTRKIGHYQEDYTLDHDHPIPHTHGASIVDGADSGNGRTGVPGWTAGVIDFDDEESGNWDIDADDDDLTADGVLTMRDPSETKTRDSGSLSCASYDNVDVDLAHYHTIPRFYGLSGLASVDPEDTTHGVPEREYNVESETTPKNVAVYYYIKY